MVHIMTQYGRRRRPHSAYSEKVVNWRKYFGAYSLWEEFTPYRDVMNMHLEAMAGCQKILDDGCGIGLMAEALLTNSDKSHIVYAIDTKATARRAVQERLKDYPKEKWKAYVDDGTHLNRNRFPQGSIDGVVSNFVINFVKNWERYLEEAYRVTREGGRISISGPLPTWEPGPILDAFERELESDVKDPERTEKMQIVEANLWKNRKERSVSEPEPERISAYLRYLGYNGINLRQDVFVGQSYFMSATKERKENPRDATEYVVNEDADKDAKENE